MTSRLVCVIVLGFTLWTCKATCGAESPSPAQSQPVNASDPIFFARDVMPVISRLGCNSVQCHGSFAGKGGMAFSLFGGSPEDDYETLVKAERAKRVNRMEPAKSPVLLKATGAIKHQGAKQIAADSPEYKTILAWIEQGARYDNPALPKLAGVSFGAAEAVLARGAARALSVAAEYSDGSQEDVTRLATFRSSDPRLAAVDAAGKVTAVGFGKCAIVGQYSRHGGAVQVIVPQPLDEPFPAFEPFNKIDELVVANLKKYEKRKGQAFFACNLERGNSLLPLYFRCVRRACLCGEGLEHRKQWIEDRLRTLSECFAASVCGFAAMDNHLHMLVRLEPDDSNGWFAKDVVRRWLVTNESRNQQILARDWLAPPFVGAKF